MTRDGWIRCLASGCGFGYSPVISGTAGTLFSIIPYWVTIHIIGGPQHWAWYAGVILVLTVLSIWAADGMMVLTNSVDPKQVIIDEVVGFFVTMFLVPFSWGNVLLGFIIFRILDIIKPWPASWLDRLHDQWGFGVTMDDVAAGIYGCLIMHIIL